jgi:hypothetical protein
MPAPFLAGAAQGQTANEKRHRETMIPQSRNVTHALVAAQREQASRHG